MVVVDYDARSAFINVAAGLTLPRSILLGGAQPVIPPNFYYV